MEQKDTETQQIFEDTLKHLKVSLSKLIDCDAPTPALEMYTSFIGKLDAARSIHKALAEIDESGGLDQLMTMLKKRAEAEKFN